MLTDIYVCNRCDIVYKRMELIDDCGMLRCPSCYGNDVGLMKDDDLVDRMRRIEDKRLMDDKVTISQGPRVMSKETANDYLTFEEWFYGERKEPVRPACIKDSLNAGDVTEEEIDEYFCYKPPGF